MLYCSIIEKFLALLGCLFISSFVFADGQAHQQQKPLLVTTIKPLTLIAHEVVDGLVNVRQLLPDGEVPHHFSVRLSQQRLLEQADLLVWIGEHMEAPLVSGVNRYRSKENTIKISGMDNLPRVQTPLSDMHFWLDAGNGRAIAQAIVSSLSARYPDMASQLHTNMQKFAERLRKYDRQAKELLSSESIVYIAEHDAYRYFVENYPTIKFVGAVHNHAAVSIGPRELSRLHELNGSMRVNCIITETHQVNNLLKNLATQLEAKLITIDPLGSEITTRAGGYTQLLEDVATGFYACKN